eukprot:m.176618 g.176618  ORF g.176618 m.176618 type:complete len:57 (+) comp53354_c0_seq1:453-623(+)
MSLSFHFRCSARQRELQAMTTGDDLSEFDRHIQAIRNSYRKNPNEVRGPPRSPVSM